MIQENAIKNNRLTSKQDSNFSLWIFETPTVEFEEFLKMQMLKAHISQGLISLMFSSDKRKAINLLIADFINNQRGLICNLDLILKWFALLLYDTNELLIIQGIDYLLVVFESISNSRCFLSEREGEYFLPHILKKLQSTSIDILSKIHQLLKIWRYVYPYSKIMDFLTKYLECAVLDNQKEIIKVLNELIELCDPFLNQPASQTAMKKVLSHFMISTNSIEAFKCMKTTMDRAGRQLIELLGDNQFGLLKQAIENSTPVDPPMQVEAASTSSIPEIR